MSNLNDFYRQKGLNELKGKVDSNRFLTTEQRERIHQIINEMDDSQRSDRQAFYKGKDLKKRKPDKSPGSHKSDRDNPEGLDQDPRLRARDEQYNEEMDNDVKDKLRSMTDKQKRALKRKLSGQNEEVEEVKEVEEEMDNDVKDKLKKMTDSQKRALKRKLSGQNEEVELDEIAMANTEYSRAHNSAKDLTKKAHASGKSDHIVAAIQAHKKALKYAKSDTNKAAHTGHIRDLSKKMTMAESVELDENLSFAEKQEALIKFGYDPTNVRYMNGEILEQAYESMINILNAQNPTQE